MGIITTTPCGVLGMYCKACGFAEVLPAEAGLDHVILAEIHHVEFETKPAVTEPGQ
jgi:hypothetical protein